MRHVVRLKLFKLAKQLPGFARQLSVAAVLQLCDQIALASDVLCAFRHMALSHLKVSFRHSWTLSRKALLVLNPRARMRVGC